MNEKKSNGRQTGDAPGSQDGGTRRDDSRDEIVTLLNKGADLLQSGRPADALPHLERAWTMDNENAAAAINLGGAYVMLGQFKLAVPILERATELEANNPMVWMNLGAAVLGNPVLAGAEKQERAIRAFERALELNPDLPNADYNLGLIYLDQGNLACAIDHFRHALQVDPFDRDAQMWIEKIGGRMAEGEGCQRDT